MIPGVDQRHHRESLINLVKLHIPRRHTCMLQGTRHRVRGSGGELHRVAGRIAEAADLEQWSELVLAGELATDNHHRRGSVVPVKRRVTTTENTLEKQHVCQIEKVAFNCT